MKIILTVGNTNIEEKIKLIDGLKVEISNDPSDLKTLVPYFTNVDYLIIEKEFINNADMLIGIAREAQKKNIRVVILTNDFESVQAKKDISILVAEDVLAYIDINEFDEDKLIEILNDYPKSFNFGLLAKDEVRVVEKIIEKKVVEEKETVRTVSKQVITCFSADNGIMSGEVAIETANLIANSTDLKVLLVDFNNINPILADILGIDRYLKNTDIYELKKQTSLEAMVNAIDRNTLNTEVFNDLIQRDKRYRFDVITGLYDLIFEDKVNGEHYNNIITMAQRKYDIVIIATNPYIKNESTYYSLVNATHILAITDNNYTAIYNLIANINYIKPNISEKEIHIVLTNNSEYSLDKDKINELFTDYKIATYIPIDDGKRDISLNKYKLYTAVANDETKLAYNNILNSLGYENKSKKVRGGFLSFKRR